MMKIQQGETTVKIRDCAAAVIAGMPEIKAYMLLESSITNASGQSVVNLSRCRRIGKGSFVKFSSKCK